MKFIQASHIAKQRLEEFIQHNQHIDIHTLLETGYVVEHQDKIIGCFSLDGIGDDAYWLKQLYVIRHEAVKLPVIVETILTIAKEKQAKVIYAHSEQPVTDLLLESLSFSLQPKTENMNQHQLHKKGHWWTYSVCS